MYKEGKDLKCFGLKVKEKTFIDLILKEGLFEKTNRATYIILKLIKDGEQRSVNLTKGEALQLSLMLNQLVIEGNNADYEGLKKQYPNQKSWHIYA
jgi:predicted ATP-grasp superfamily ATP-dependent carboligase